MRLLFLVPASWQNVSGGNLYNLQLAQALQANGHTVELLAYDGEELARNMDLNVPWDAVLVDSLLSSLWKKSATFSRPHIGMMHVPQSFLELRQDLHAKVKAQDQKFMRQLDGLIFVSAATLQKACQEFSLPKPCFVNSPGRAHIPNSDLGLGKEAPSKGLRLLSVGRMDSNKRQLLLLEYLQKFKEACPHVAFHLTLCGPEIDGYFTQFLSLAIEKAGLKEQVSWTGALSPEQVSAYYREADIYVCPSAYESWGMAIAEAMGFGLVIINFAQGGAEELTLRAGGYQVSSSTEFIGSLQKLWQNRALYQEKSRHSLVGYRQLPCWDAQARGLVSWLQKTF